MESPRLTPEQQTAVVAGRVFVTLYAMWWVIPSVLGGSLLVALQWVEVSAIDQFQAGGVAPVLPVLLARPLVGVFELALAYPMVQTAIQRSRDGRAEAAVPGSAWLALGVACLGVAWFSEAAAGWAVNFALLLEEYARSMPGVQRVFGGQLPDEWRFSIQLEDWWLLADAAIGAALIAFAGPMARRWAVRQRRAGSAAAG